MNHPEPPPDSPYFILRKNTWRFKFPGLVLELKDADKYQRGIIGARAIYELDYIREQLSISESPRYNVISAQIREWEEWMEQ
jgi:hypothetical protein